MGRCSAGHASGGLVSGRALIETGADAITRWIARLYFEVSYRVLAGTAGREFLHAASDRDEPAVHGYATALDIQALVEALHPLRGETLLDLGCGNGEVAITIHRRTGCRVIGIDAARRAVTEARRRAANVGVQRSVRFLVGDLGSPPTGASAAYALDSLMFARRPAHVLASVSHSLEPPGRVFVTFVDHRGLDRRAFARLIEGTELRLESLDDVTPELDARSRKRASVARRTIRARRSPAGGLGLLLVLAEETAVMQLIRRGRLRRWRFTTIRADTSSSPS
ncbi:MAG: class I SAM-dependent methyltransferase [Actinobacteria bacterium]|nr:class I SAM-dependent methyltransferase [Actinomycetota bacterium]